MKMMGIAHEDAAGACTPAELCQIGHALLEQACWTDMEAYQIMCCRSKACCHVTDYQSLHAHQGLEQGLLAPEQVLAQVWAQVPGLAPSLGPGLPQALGLEPPQALGLEPPLVQGLVLPLAQGLGLGLAQEQRLQAPHDDSSVRVPARGAVPWVPGRVLGRNGGAPDTVEGRVRVR